MDPIITTEEIKLAMMRSNRESGEVVNWNGRSRYWLSIIW